MILYNLVKTKSHMKSLLLKEVSVQQSHCPVYAREIASMLVVIFARRVTENQVIAAHKLKIVRDQMYVLMILKIPKT